MNTITLTKSNIDIFEQILAVPDPEPAEQWVWRIGGSLHNTDHNDLESIGELRDLISGLLDEHFLVVSRVNLAGVFTQCARQGDRFRTECSEPAPGGNIMRHYSDADGYLSMALCQTVMGAYIMSNGNLPHLDGYTAEQFDY